MKKLNLFAVLFVIVAIIPSCLKDKTCKLKTVESESAQIQAFAAANNINAVHHSSGLYYEIIDPGSGPVANASSNISITYVGKLMNGTTFDDQLTPNSPAWPLSGLIQGWVIGIPLIHEGGHIKLLIPSSLAYGCADYHSIPGNSVLYFDINLVDVQ